MSLWVAITWTSPALSKLSDQMGAPLPGRERKAVDGGCVDTFCGLVLMFEHTQAKLPPVDSSPLSVFVQASLKAPAAPT